MNSFSTSIGVYVDFSLQLSFIIVIQLISIELILVLLINLSLYSKVTRQQ